MFNTLKSNLEKVYENIDACVKGFPFIIHFLLMTKNSFIILTIKTRTHTHTYIYIDLFNKAKRKNE